MSLAQATQPVRGRGVDASQAVLPEQLTVNFYSIPWREHEAVLSRTLNFDPMFLPCRPVHWEANDSSLTWQNQLSGQEISTIMDLHSGGQHLKIFQPATYRCFVEQELIAQFNPTPAVYLLEAERQSKAQEPWQSRIQPGKADSVLRGLKLMLLIVSVLVIGGLLCKVVFRPICGKKRNQVLLVK